MSRHTAITTSVKYFSDGTAGVWPIPFPYGDPSQVSAKIVDAEGQERVLRVGTDCLLNRGCLLAVVPAGQSLVIWLNVPMEDAMQGAADRPFVPSVPPGPVIPGPVIPGPVMPPPPSGPDPVVTKLAAQVAELQRERDEALIAARAAEADAQVQRLKAEGQAQADRLAGQAGSLSDGVAAELEAVAREHLARLEAEATNLARAAVEAQSQAAAAQKSASEARAQLAQAVNSLRDAVDKARQDALEGVASAASLGSTTNLEGYFEQGMDRVAGEVLNLPAGLVYYPGRAMLRVSYQGTTLSCGKHFEEVGEADVLSGSIRPLFASRAGDQWGFWVVASNVGAMAEEAAERAERARDEAVSAATEAGKDADDAETARAGAEESARLAGLWESASELCAEEAWRLAQCAWKAAYQAGMASTRPGIAAVKDAAELEQCQGGLYVVNPHLAQTPTTFMGVWPVSSVESIAWDGVFFIGPAYPDNPTPPPVPCDPPQQPSIPDAGSGDAGSGDAGSGGGGSGNAGSGGFAWKPCGGA